MDNGTQDRSSVTHQVVDLYRAAKSQPWPTASYRIVTPDLAREWLAERNNHNRPISTRRVEAVARDITNGCFEITHQGIALGTDGQIYDGQHRLAAIVLANKPVAMLVVTGLGPKARSVIDTGRVRSVADNLTLSGRERARFKVAIVNAISVIETNRSMISVPEIDARIAELDGPLTWAMGVFSNQNKLTRADVVAGIVYGYDLDHKKVDEFAKRYLTGENLSAGDPALTLRNFVLEKRHSKGGMSYSVARRITTAKALRSVEAHVNGEKILKLMEGSDSAIARVAAILGRNLP